jgi:zona occludens toxin
MIFFSSGLPRSGKTLWVISYVDRVSKQTGRPVYYHGIQDVKIPGWTELKDATKWMELPAGAMLIIDEAQDVFPLKLTANGIPEFVKQLSVHGHEGIDIFLISQHPMFIDSYPRRLIDTHWHVVNIFGAERATVYQFKGVREQVDKSREGAISRFEWSYPKEYYPLYKSATLHLRKREIPMKLKLLALVPILLLGLGYYAYSSLFNHDVQKAEGAVKAQPATTSPGTYQANKPLSVLDYVAEIKPRIDDIPQSAPRYDSLTAPQVAPKAAACLSSASHGCRCYSQQATPLAIADATCRQIVKQGWFDDTLAPSLPNKDGSIISGKTEPRPPAGLERSSGV